MTWSVCSRWGEPGELRRQRGAEQRLVDALVAGQAMQLIFTPFILRLVEQRRRAFDVS